MNTPDFLKNYDDLCAQFTIQGIPFDKPGFFDHPKFRSIEKTNKLFFGCYARFVQRRPRTAAYNDRVRQIVPKIAEILHNELEAEGRLGACVDLSIVLSRILDEEKIWNYPVKGALTLSFPSSVQPNPIHICPMDIGTQKVGHVWVAAPPFNVIDLTVRQLRYPKSAIRESLPRYVLLDKINPIEPTSDELVSKAVQAIARVHNRSVPPDLHFLIDPNLHDVFEAFAANQSEVGQVYMRYIPTGFDISNKPLKQITTQKWNGRCGFEIYRDLITGHV